MVPIQLKAKDLLEVLAEFVEMNCGNFEGPLAGFAGQVSVHDPGEVVHRRRLAQMGVHDDLQLLELLEDPVDGLTSGSSRCTEFVMASAVRWPLALTKTSATVRLATVTRFEAPRMVEKIPSTVFSCSGIARE